MVICCENNSSHWLAKDYYLVDFNNLDELQEYLQNKLPIKAKQIKLKDSRYIFSELDTTQYKLIYLNNYKQIYSIDLIYLTEEEIKNLTKNQCEQCEFYEYIGMGIYKCKYTYEPDKNNKCICFSKKKKSTFFKKLISIFGF